MSRGAPLVLLAVLVIASSVAAVGKPTLAVGDAWVFTGPAPADGTREIKAAVTSTDGGNVVVTRNDWTNTTGVPAPPPLPSTGGSSLLVRTVTTYDANMAVVSVETSTSQSSGGSSLDPGLSRTTRTYDPPCPVLRFPLTVGANWTADCKGTTTGAGQVQGGTPFTWKANFEVTAHENVTLTNTTTTFGAYKIVNMTGGKANDVQWYAPAACTVVKTADATGKTTTELVSFECASPVADDYVPPAPPEDDAPPATNGTDGNETDDDVPPADDNTTDDGNDTDDTGANPPPEPEDEGFLGLPAPGAWAVLAVAGLAAVAWRRRS